MFCWKWSSTSVHLRCTELDGDHLQQNAELQTTGAFIVVLPEYVPN